MCKNALIYIYNNKQRKTNMTNDVYLKYPKYVTKSFTLTDVDELIKKEYHIVKARIVKTIHLAEQKYNKVSGSLMKSRSLWKFPRNGAVFSEVVEVTCDNQQPFYIGDRRKGIYEVGRLAKI